VDNPVLKAKIVSLTAQLQDSINNNSVLSNKLMQVQTNLNICESKITVPTINDNIQNGNVESLRKVNAKIAELQGILTQIGLIISTDSLSDIKATLKETYDIYGSHIFSNEVLVGISGTGSWKLPIKKVIESQLTSLKVLQAQYQSY
jgi:alkyl hydroperoxide reductase subunit AhpF